MTTFKEDLDNDLSAMLDSSEFGTSITYNPDGGSSFSVDVVIDNDPVLVDLGDNNEQIRDSRRMLQIKVSDFVSIPVANVDTFTIDAVTYDIYDVEPDDTGYAIVILNNQ